jgi:hypothetical protein
MLNKKVVIALAAIVMLFLGIFSFAQSGDSEAPTITLSGDEKVTIEVGETYTDEGATATDDVDGDLTDEIDITNNVDEDVIGTYYVTYNVSDASGNDAEEVKRTVYVVDEKVPLISLLGNKEVTIEVGSTYADAGATAVDNYDGVITDDIVTVNNVNDDVIGTYYVIYNVTDSEGNKALEVVRTVNVVDTTNPVISLNGESNLTIEVGSAYTDAGATATDNYDEVITDKIVTVNNVINDKVGTYTVTYNVTDNKGNKAQEVVRTVHVVDTTKPVISLASGSDEAVILELGNTYEEPGFTATDNYDNDITKNVVITSTLNPNVIGTYTITYNVIDAFGNVANTVKRIVNVVDTTKPVVKLIDGDKTVEVNTPFVDPGVTITDNSNESLKAILTVYYSRTGADSTWVAAPNNKVDTTKLGKYAIWYGAKDSSNNSASSVRRYVTVVDTTKPVVKLIDGDKTVEVNTPFVDPGVTITDNSNESLKAILTVYYSRTGADSTWVAAPNNKVDTTKLGKYAIWYGAKDSSNNSASSVRRYVTVVDTTKPVISLIGGSDEAVILELGNTYEEPGFTVMDNYDNDITNKVVITSNINPNVVGTYTVTYTATDSSGNIATLTRTVIVRDTTAPTVTFGTNGNSAYAKNASSTVNVADKGEINLTSLKYVWTNSTQAPLIEQFNNSFTNDEQVNAPAGLNGVYYLWISAKDKSGNGTVVRSEGFYLDNIAPVITIKNESVGSIANKIFSNVSFKLYDEHQVKETELNGVLKSYSPNTWSDLNGVTVGNLGAVYGKNTLVLRDIAGNTTTIEFYLDNKAPEITIKEESVGSMSDKIFSNVSFKLHDEYKIKETELNGVLKSYSPNTWSDLNGVSVGKLGAVYGKNILVLRDLAGNTTSIEFYLDNKAPEITIKEESIGSMSDKIFSNVSFKLYDEYKVLETKLNGVLKSYSPNTWSDLNNVTVGNLGAVYGKNTLVLKDLAGNTTTIEFYLDNKMPDITIKNESIGSMSDKIFSNVSFKLHDEYKIKETELNGVLKSYTPNTWSDLNNVTVGNLGAVYGKNTLVLRDLAGNTASIEFYLDNKGPEITIKPESVGSISDKIFSNVSFKLHDEYKIKETELNGVLKSYTPSVWSDLNGVTAGKLGAIAGENTLVLRDIAGNTTTYNFFIDNVKPVITVVSPNKYDVEAGTSYVDKGYSAFDSKDGDITNKVVVTYRYNNGGNWEVKPNVDTLLFGEWVVWYNVADRAGNIANRATRTFVVRDTAAPTITGVVSSPNTLTTGPVTLAINASDSGIGLSSSAYSFDNGTTWQSSNEKTFNDNGTIYIKVRDALGNASTYTYTISNIVISNITFDEGTVTLSNIEEDNKWYTDRFAPKSFTTTMFDNSYRLNQLIDVSDGATSRPSPYVTSFYNTQGRKFNTSNATKVSIDLYIPSEWETTNRRMAGLWGTGFDTNDDVSSYPIIEFASDHDKPRFQGYNTNTGEWIDLGLPSSFQYDKWYTLTIELNAANHTFEYKVSDISYSLNDENNTAKIGNIILQGYNTNDGVTYNIYWDNLITKK